MTMDTLRQRAAALSPETRAIIGGKFADSLSGRRFPTLNPANGKHLPDVAETGAEDVDVAVDAGRRAFESGRWSKMVPKDRKRILLRLADLVEKNAEDLALLETLDNGKPYADAVSADLPDAIETIRWHAETIDKIYGQVSPTPQGVVSMVVREPIGVVGAVIPWNFPLAITAMKLAPVLAAGNSLLVKPAEQTPLTALALARLAAEAGLPEDVLSLLPGFGETTGQAMGRHMGIDCLSFTGSTEVGRYFLKYSAESNLKKVTLELGGKSPVIAMDGLRNIQNAADQIAMGILFSQGENCSAGSRLIVHRKIKERLLEAVRKTFNAWAIGDPLDPATKIGALIEEAHLKRILGFIECGKAQGAKLLIGGERLLEKTGGYFLGPTIFDDVSNKMRIAQEEIFGLVLSVITVDSEEEAIASAIDTDHGLAASLHTDDLHAAHRMAAATRAGTVSVNCFSEGDNAVPFGCFEMSGFGGREKGLFGHDQYTEPKTIWIQIEA